MARTCCFSRPRKALTVDDGGCQCPLGLIETAREQHGSRTCTVRVISAANSISFSLSNTFRREVQVTVVVNDE
jgi:hypothetical protein